MPQQLKLALNSTATVLKPGEPAVVDIDGRFCTAPGRQSQGGSRTGDWTRTPTLSGFPRLPFRIGAGQLDRATFPSGAGRHRRPGQGTGVDRAGDTRHQPTVTGQSTGIAVRTGRAAGVNRNLDLPYRTQPSPSVSSRASATVASRPARDAVFGDRTSTRLGQPLARTGCAELVREDYQYYWYHDEGRWNYKLIIRDSTPAGGQTLNLRRPGPW